MSVALANALSSIVRPNRSSSATISSTRSSELRPSSSSVVPPATGRPPVNCASSASTPDPCAVVMAARAARGDPVAHLLPLELPRALGPRQFLGRPDRDAANLLVVEQRQVGLPDQRLRVHARLGDDDGVHALFGAASHAHDRDVAHAGQRSHDPFDVLRKDVQPFRRDDHLLLAALDEDSPVGVHFADVAGVKPPALKRLRRGLGSAEIAFRDVVAPDEDLAVLGDLHLDAGNGLADRSLAGAEGVIQADDRRRLGEAVALDHHEAEPAPELLERRIERRGADDEAPELQPEEPVRAAIPPPAPREVLFARRRLGRLGRRPQHVLAQHVEDLRHRHQHGHAARLDLPHDVVRVEAAHEHDRARQQRRDEGRHRLAEHVAQRQQVEEPDGRKRPRVLPVLHDLVLDRHDVGQDVAMRDDHAFRLGGGSRREDDLRRVVAGDGGAGRLARRVPVELGQRPHGASGRPGRGPPRRRPAPGGR